MPQKLEDFVKFSDFVWKFFQIDLFDASDNKAVKKLAIYAFHAVILIIQSVCNTGSIYPLNFETFVFIFSAFASISYTHVKFASIWWSQERLKRVIRSLPESYSHLDSFKYQSGVFYSKFRAILVIYSSYTFMPVIFMFLESFGEWMATGARKLPMLIVYPFDTSGTFSFPLAFALVIYGYGTYWLANVTSDRLLYGIVTALSLEFRVLRVKLAELKFASESTIKSELHALIQRHNQLIDNVREIQDIFFASFFLNFALSSLYICFHLFLFTTATDSASAAMSVMFCVYSTFFILLQCFFGQMLRDESDGVINGILDCEWHRITDARLRRDFVMLIMRVQKSVGLSIVNMWPINIEQFGSVLTSSYSYFTICRRLYADTE